MARVIAVTLLLTFVPAPARAYSVLAHEANVDALWDSHIRPLLQQRFPRATRDEIAQARAYAYGGSVIQDVGYYPFGSHFFSNLLHYVKSGDFVEAMLRDAQTVNECAFAIGALSHYAADNTGHPEATNLAVPMVYPKLEKKFGDRVTYVQSPASHVIVEFSFDVVQAAAGAYLPEAYHGFIGFEVAKPVLERAFRETYGLEVKDVFGDEDLAISTYRYAVSQLVPEITETAWKTKKDDIIKLMPKVDEGAFVYRFTRVEYEKEYGTNYRKPGFFAKVITFLYRLLPKIGPLKPLSFKAPTPEAERLFADSFKDTRARYARALDELRAGHLQLPNTNFDTGRPAKRGEYSLADKTYDELDKRLARAKK